MAWPPVLYVLLLKQSLKSWNLQIGRMSEAIFQNIPNSILTIHRISPDGIEWITKGSKSSRPNYPFPVWYPRKQEIIACLACAKCTTVRAHVTIAGLVVPHYGDCGSRCKQYRILKQTTRNSPIICRIRGPGRLPPDWGLS